MLLHAFQNCDVVEIVDSRFFMKLFKTSNIETVRKLSEFLGFEVPSVVWAKLVDKFESKFAEFIVFDLTTCL